MKKLSFKIDVYDWEVYLYQLEAKDNGKSVTKVLQKHHIPVEMNQDVIDDIDDDSYDGGWAFNNADQHTHVVILQQFSSKNKKIEVYSHEKRHVEDDILRRLRVNNDDEAAAYLAGYLATMFAKLSDSVKTYKTISNGKNKKKR